MHTATAREARNADLVFVNSEFTAADVAERLGIARERIRVAYPGVGADVLSRGAALRQRIAVRLHHRHHRLAQEPRDVACGRDASSASSHSGTSVTSTATSAAGALPRRGGVRVPLALRGLRHARRRGDGEWRPVRRVVAPVARRGGGDAAVRVDPDDPEAIAAGIREALERREELVPRGSRPCAPLHLARDGARASSELR